MAKLRVDDTPVHIVAILDRSGSMSSLVDSSVAGFNEFLKSNQSMDGEAKISVVLFDDKYEVLFDDVDVKECPKLSTDTFVPRGMTALHDAIGKSLTSLFKENPKRAIVCILTDGMENASKEFNAASVKALIDKAKARDWGVVYLAANQDAFAVGGALGINKALMRNFVPTDIGNRSAYTETTMMVSAYRSNENNGS